MTDREDEIIRIAFLILIVMMALAFWIGRATASEIDLTASYDNYTTPNVSNNYDDGKGLSVGIKHPIWRDLKGNPEFTHISDVDFPTKVDPKGSFGELRGYGMVYNLLYEMKYDKNLTFTPYVGLGGVWWQFRENPYLQEANVTVKTDPSIILKAGLGIDYKLRKDWKLSLSAGWFDTNIAKKATNSKGDELQILDADSNIGLQYFTWKVGIKRRF